MAKRRAFRVSEVAFGHEPQSGEEVDIFFN